jgi:hypothetical protein
LYYSRAITQEIKEYLNYFPVLLISGARQVGKSTLCLHLDIPNYVTLDNINTYEMAKNDPLGFLQSLRKPVIIDEIQRMPSLLVSIKEEVDKDRKNGQFILTGSASLQGFKDISETLAGRIGIVELYGLSQKEFAGKDENIIDILSGELDSFVQKSFSGEQIAKAIIGGSYPEISKIDNLKARHLWFSSYIRTYIEADAKELASIRNMDGFTKMYRLCMLRSANLFNKNEIQKECGLDNKTFDSYFKVLEHTYQVSLAKPYFSNNIKRLIKTPKVFATDSGVLCHLLDITNIEELEKSHFKGAIYETFVYDELLKANTSAARKVNIYHYRTVDKKEIDFILETGNNLTALEIKCAKSINMGDFKHIVNLRESSGERFSKGIIFYNGDSVLRFEDNLYALPFGFLQ